MLAALKTCREANSQRNRVIHDAWATRPGNVRVTLPGSRDSHEVMVTVRTPAEVRRVADQVAQAADKVKDAMTAALGTGWALVEDQLRHELGRDISDDASA